MKQQFLAILTVFIGTLFGATEVCASDDFDSRDVLIRFKSESTVAERTEFEQREELILVREIRSIRVRLYRLPNGADVEAIVARYAVIPIIDFAEPNYFRHQAAVSDPDYPLQWSLNNTGQVVNNWVGPADIDINWPEAMAQFTGTTSVNVAVIDSGLSLLHPDLVGNLFLNTAELDGIEGVDDDNNFLIDDSFGYDFYANNALPIDENGHGTLVASIIAGGVDNGINGTGICPTALILPLRITNQFGQGGAPNFARVSDLALALEYAGLMGIDVVNVSFGGSTFSETELLVLRLLSQNNVLIVAAAGNGGNDGMGDNIDSAPFYPAAYDVPSLISVAAQDRSGGLARFSNFGVNAVDLAAPGTEIYGADITRQVVFEEYFQAGATGWTVGEGAGNLSTDSWLIESFSGIQFLADHELAYPTYLPNANTWVQSPMVDLQDFVGSRLQFDSLLSLADDYLLVELSLDGVYWEIYRYYSGSNNGFSTQQIDISDFDLTSAFFRFRLLTDDQNEGAGVGIGNIEITAVDPLNQDDAATQITDGTSFSAPMVAGVAALLMSQRPDLTAAQVKSIILYSVRSVPALAGKVSSGGMLDASAALALAIQAPYAPNITEHPADQTANLGADVSMTVVASGTAPFSYQWSKDGNDLDGKTSATLNLASVSTADEGSYSVRVSNAAGVDSSNAAELTINTPPVILTQPRSQNVVLGSSASFSVEVESSTAVTYQWRKNGVEIAGATSRVFSIPTTGGDDSASYIVSILNEVGSTFSSAASLTVISTTPRLIQSLPTIDLTPTGSSTHVDLSSYFAFSNVVGTIIQFDTVLGKFNVELYGNDAPLNVTNFLNHVEAGLYSNTFIHRSVPNFIIQGGGYRSEFNLPAIAPLATVPLEYKVPNHRGTLAMARSSDPNSADSQWFINTVDNSETLKPLGTGAEGYTVIGRVLGLGLDVVDRISDLPIYNVSSFFNEMPLYNYVGGSVTLGNLATIYGVEEIPLYPTIGSSNAAITFTISSSNAAVVGASLSGSQLTLTPGNQGSSSITIRATDSNGSFVEGQIPVIVSTTAPEIITQPSSQIRVVGADAYFEVQATGTGILSYQWMKDGENIYPDGNSASVASSTWTISNVTSSDAGNYAVRVTNTGGSVLSASATLTVVNQLANHSFSSAGYTPGMRLRTDNSLTFSGSPSSVLWSVLLPDGWSFNSGGGEVSSTSPTTGDTGLIEWTWSSLTPPQLDFHYYVNVPANASGTKSIVAMVTLQKNGEESQILVDPDPLSIPFSTFHSADVNGDFKLSLSELLRVIEIYNTRFGTTRTGRYQVQDGSVDGFATNPNSESTSLSRFHSADSNHDAQIGLSELLRVIELYNVREGSMRTGQYRVQLGTSDGFTTGI